MKEQDAPVVQYDKIIERLKADIDKRKSKSLSRWKSMQLRKSIAKLEYWEQAKALHDKGII